MPSQRHQQQEQGKTFFLQDPRIIIMKIGMDEEVEVDAAWGGRSKSADLP